MTRNKKKSVTQATRNKALKINHDKAFYGSFAEIGAGQEVARHFFQAGLASQTVAKSMSAYDKAFSDSIYGKGTRFVSETRLNKMLEHEYGLLEKRLKDRSNETCFFAFANTVATSSHEKEPTCHGWMGVRFQSKPSGPYHDVILHVRMLDNLRLQQQEALGILGVNLLYACHSLTDDGSVFISSLMDNLGNDRIEIEFIKFTGKDLSHIDNRLMSLELVKQNITSAVMFDPSGEPLCPSDALYAKNVFVQRGTFRPITNVNLELSEIGCKQFQKDLKTKKTDIVSLMEITMKGLKQSGKIDDQDFLNRVDSLGAVGQTVMVSNFHLYSEVSEYLMKKTSENISLVIGADTLPLIFDPQFYNDDEKSMLQAFTYLFSKRSNLYVFPFKDEDSCTTSRTFFPKGPILSLYKYFLDSEKIKDLSNCDDLDTSIKAMTVRKLMAKKDAKWESMVPAEVRTLIKKKKMFQ